MAQRLIICLALLASLIGGVAPTYAQSKSSPDNPIRTLRAREHRISAEARAEKKADAARLATIKRHTSRQMDALANEKARILEKIDAFADDLSPEQRRAQVDPVFDQLVALRRKVHQHFEDALGQVHDAKAPIAKAARALNQAEAALSTERARKSQLGGSAVWTHRVAVAQAQVERAKQALASARAILAAYRHRARVLRAHTGFFTDTIESLLDRISDQRRAAFFALDRQSNWHDALTLLQSGIDGVTVRTGERLEQAVQTDALAVDLWAWLWGLLWRLALVIVLGRVFLRLAPGLVDRLSEAMLRRRFLMRHPTPIIKAAELLRALSKPAVVFAAAVYVAHYVAATLVEFRALVWLIDAVCVYWLVIEAAKVMVLPRWFRHAQAHPSAVEFDHIDEDEVAAVADLLVIELPRAKKLVHSVRVALVFWLMSEYLPSFLEPITGVTVIWWLVNELAVWGFVGVLYWVLSQWKDDIAAGFEQLASDRLAGVATFVHKHKDRPWGVLVIAAASLYVVSKELAIIARRYLLDTRWAKRASTFAFRTKIELQSHEDEEAEADNASSIDRLPPDYVSVFESRPLVDEPYRVERTTYTDKVFARFDRWRDDPRQGSVTLLGEPGVGKTTLLHALGEQLADRAPLRVVHTALTHKLRRPRQVLEFVAEIFELDDVPASTEALIARLRQLEPRVVLIDDCHNAFTREIEGFDSLDTLLDIVNLCDATHFFVLTFNRFAWTYANRINSREYYFGDLITLEAWSEDEIQQLIEKRNAQTNYAPSFNDLMSTRAEVDLHDYFFEVVKTANGYFRYLHEFCGGNPSVATKYWLRSLRPGEEANALQVGLFRRPSLRELTRCSDDHWFLLSALAQHGELDAAELARIVNVPLGFCSLALDYFAEERVVRVDRDSGRARLTPLFLRQVLKHLSNSNFLYG